MKISPEGFKCRFDQAEERISELEDESTEIIKSEEKKMKELRKINRASELCGTSSGIPT